MEKLNSSEWRARSVLADGSKRLVAAAKVSSSNINQPIGIEEFRWG